MDKIQKIIEQLFNELDQLAFASEYSLEKYIEIKKRYKGEIQK